MVRPAKLTLALLGVAVLLGHVLGLEWISRQADQISGLTLMAPTMYTRTVKPTTPPPVVASASTGVAKPKVRAAQRPKLPASSAEELRRKKEAEARAKREEEERERAEAEADARASAEAAERARAVREERARAEAERARAEQVAQAAAAAASASQPTASEPAAAASAAASAPASDTAALDRWPVDTRLTYVLSGQFRGPLYGDARVQWQRDGGKYQVRLDARIQLFGTQVLTSQGEVTPDGLLPHIYEELRPGKRRTNQFGDEVVVLDNGSIVPRPPGVQDTASQFVELTQRFATGRDVLEVGRSVKIWLARPGGVNEWMYDIVAREPLRTPSFGTVETFHLKPRAVANPRGNITVEMWYAPSLQYLPARIRIVMGEDTWLDLLVDHIEQR